MSAQERVPTGYLEFFNAAILDPALKYYELAESNERGSLTAEFGLVETVHWARLGVQIGYFDKKDAQDLISSSDGVLRAWVSLRDRQAISTEDDWASIVRLDADGHPALNWQMFSLDEEIDPKSRELLQGTFQTFLLLTSENILDEDTLYLLDSIAWTRDELWNARKTGMVNRRLGSAQAIGAGFANVLNYFEEMEFTSRHAILVSDDGVALRNPQDSVYEEPIPSLIDEVRQVLRPRFALSYGRTVDRYFSFAGDFVRRTNDNSPAWLDARLAAFDRLVVLIAYAGGDEIVYEQKARLWNLFTTGVNGFSNEGATSQADSRENDRQAESSSESI